AIAAEPRLLADSDVLAQREASLADALREIIDASRLAFTGVEQSAAIADGHFAEVLAVRHDPDVEQNVETIRASVAHAAGAAAALARIWQEERAGLDAGPGQARVAARYETIEAAARRYLESTANAAGVVKQALDAISQGGDEPTKRLVLHNTLAQHAQPALDAQESLAAA